MTSAITLTPVWLRICELLLAQTERHWTVRTLTEALTQDTHASTSAVRDTVNLLLTHRILAIVPHERATTVCLTLMGEQNLAVWLRRARQDDTTDTTNTGRR